VKLPVLTAADGAGWEAAFVVGFEGMESSVTVVRRCVDVVDLLSIAASGQARAALVAESLRKLDADAVDRLLASGVVAVGVVGRGDTEAEDRLRALGIVHVVAHDTKPAILASVLEQAVAGEADRRSPSRAFAGSQSLTVAAGSVDDAAAPIEQKAPPQGDTPRTGIVIAVWGPTGAPGRSTVAVTLADELSRFGSPSLLIDADVYGGVLAPTLGLLDESPGLAAACRQAGNSKLGPVELAALSWQISPTLRVLTGSPRADRWPELRASAVGNVTAAGRSLADFVVVDLGFCLETDEELSYDSLAPRRNGLTLAFLDVADLIIAVGSADPLGLQRLIRGLNDLREAEVSGTVWVVVNRVRGEVVPGNPSVELTAALDRFSGRTPAALLPYDRAALDAALAVGKTVGEVRPNSDFRLAVSELAGAIAGRTRARHRRRKRS
jgi:MinD-like ATPase involved in chromosome partitioning or flagellar assembly